MKDVRGLVIPLPTVFDNDGELDEPVLREMIDYYVGAGVNGMFIGGSMGQGPAMTHDERARLFRLACEQVNRRVPVICHIGTADPYTTIKLGKEAVAAGTDGVAVVGPYYYSDRAPADIRACFRMVGEAIDLPILLYNNPKYQGYSITGELAGQIVQDNPRVFGAKLALGGIDEALIYRNACGPDFKCFALASGIYPGMLMGIAGTVSPPLTLLPEIGVACVKAVDQGDHKKALELQQAIVELQGALMSPSLRKICGRGVYVAGLRLAGFDVKVYPRWPTADVPPEGVERIETVLNKARAALQASRAQAAE